MARVKTGVVRRRRHKSILKLARGFFSARHRHFRKAKEQLEQTGTPFLGVILNKYDVSGDRYGAYGAYGNYGNYGKKHENK